MHMEYLSKQTICMGIKKKKLKNIKKYYKAHSKNSGFKLIITRYF